MKWDLGAMAARGRIRLNGVWRKHHDDAYRYTLGLPVAAAMRRRGACRGPAGLDRPAEEHAGGALRRRGPASLHRRVPQGLERHARARESVVGQPRNEEPWRSDRRVDVHLAGTPVPPDSGHERGARAQEQPSGQPVPRRRTVARRDGIAAEEADG